MVITSLGKIKTIKKSEGIFLRFFFKTNHFFFKNTLIFEHIVSKIIFLLLAYRYIF